MLKAVNRYQRPGRALFGPGGPPQKRSMLFAMLGLEEVDLFETDRPFSPATLEGVGVQLELHRTMKVVWEWQKPLSRPRTKAFSIILGSYSQYFGVDFVSHGEFIQSSLPGGFPGVAARRSAKVVAIRPGKFPAREVSLDPAENLDRSDRLRNPLLRCSPPCKA